MTLFSPLFGAFLYFVAGINSIPQIRVSQQRDEAAQLFTGNDDPRVTDVAPYSAPNFPH